MYAAVSALRPSMLQVIPSRCRSSGSSGVSWSAALSRSYASRQARRR